MAISAVRKTLLEGQVKRLRKKERWAFRSHHGRNDFYRYLNLVLTVYWTWKDTASRKTKAQQVAELCKLKKRSSDTALHILIDASTERDVRTRSRWAQGLGFAAKKRGEIEKKGFDRFWYKYYSVANCALAVPRVRTEDGMAKYDLDGMNTGRGRKTAR